MVVWLVLVVKVMVGVMEVMMLIILRSVWFAL